MSVSDLYTGRISCQLTRGCFRVWVREVPLHFQGASWVTGEDTRAERSLRPRQMGATQHHVMSLCWLNPRFKTMRKRVHCGMRSLQAGCILRSRTHRKQPLMPVLSPQAIPVGFTPTLLIVNPFGDGSFFDDPYISVVRYKVRPSDCEYEGATDFIVGLLSHPTRRVTTLPSRSSIERYGVLVRAGRQAATPRTDAPGRRRASVYAAPACGIA